MAIHIHTHIFFLTQSIDCRIQSRRSVSGQLVLPDFFLAMYSTQICRMGKNLVKEFITPDYQGSVAMVIERALRQVPFLLCWAGCCFCEIRDHFITLTSSNSICHFACHHQRRRDGEVSTNCGLSSSKHWMANSSFVLCSIMKLRIPADDQGENLPPDGAGRLNCVILSQLFHRFADDF